MSITLKPAVLVVVVVATAAITSGATALVMRQTMACGATSDAVLSSPAPEDARDAASRRARAHPGSAVRGEKF